MIQRSGGKGQKVNSHLADEVFAEHGSVEAEGVAPDPGFEVLDRPEDIAAGRELITKGR